VALRAGLALEGVASERRLAEWVLVVTVMGAVLVCSCEVVIWAISPSRGSRRLTTFITPFRSAGNSFLEKLVEKFALAVPARLPRDLAQCQLGNEPGVARREK
jgi:hypothetical protein